MPDDNYLQWYWGDTAEVVNIADIAAYKYQDVAGLVLVLVLVHVHVLVHIQKEQACEGWADNSRRIQTTHSQQNYKLCLGCLASWTWNIASAVVAEGSNTAVGNCAAHLSNLCGTEKLRQQATGRSPKAPPAGVAERI